MSTAPLSFPSGIDESDYLEILPTFLEEISSAFCQITKADSQDDPTTIWQKAHFIHGSAASFRAHQVEMISERLEVEAKLPEAAQTAFYIDQLKVAIIDLIEYAAKHFQMNAAHYKALLADK